jgi:hypothetical protein
MVEICVEKACPVEVCVTEVCPAQVCPAQVCPAQVYGFFSVLLSPRIPCPHAFLELLQVLFVCHSAHLAYTLG